MTDFLASTLLTVSLSLRVNAKQGKQSTIRKERTIGREAVTLQEQDGEQEVYKERGG